MAMPYGHGGLLLMLQLFSDDSGKLKDSAVCVLAGYLSTAERWAAFADEWAAALSQPPATRYFKMKEAMRLKDEFLGFDEKQRDDRVRTLVGIITRHAMAGFISVIPSEPFRADHARMGRPRISESTEKREQSRTRVRGKRKAQKFLGSVFQEQKASDYPKDRKHSRRPGSNP
ncbi:MAG TPA: hypothetical protein DCL72_01260 [Rhizobiales bacterium]|nr:hypothetical protein [Hyphomicrobiales bacterium]